MSDRASNRNRTGDRSYNLTEAKLERRVWNRCQNHQSTSRLPDRATGTQRTAAAITNSDDLNEENKTIAEQETGTLAEAAKNPKDGKLKQAAKRAVATIRGTVAALPTATTLVEEVNNLLAQISNFLP